MFSRSTAPAHCARGSDSMGRQVRCCPISSSAWAGLNTDSPLRIVLVFGLVGPDLLVEAVRHALQLIDRGVVLLDLNTIQILEGLLLLGRARLVADLARGSVMLALDAGQIGVDRLVVALDSLLPGDHFVLGGGVAVGQLVRGRWVAAVRVNRPGRQCRESGHGNECSHRVIPVCGWTAILVARQRPRLLCARAAPEGR